MLRKNISKGYKEEKLFQNEQIRLLTSPSSSSSAGSATSSTAGDAGAGSGFLALVGVIKDFVGVVVGVVVEVVAVLVGVVAAAALFSSSTRLLLVLLDIFLDDESLGRREPWEASRSLSFLSLRSARSTLSAAR